MKKLRRVLGAIPLSALTLVTLASLAACGPDDGADDCQSAACTNLGTKPANKSHTFCGEQGASGGVSGDAEKWLWSVDTGTCTCEVQLNQLYWKNCTFVASSKPASGTSGNSSASAEEGP